MNIALFFGSFNPPHRGHLMVANQTLDTHFIDEVWFVISPQSPFKLNKTLIDENIRLQMIQLAIKNTPHLRECDVEFSLPKPNYSIDTLHFLCKKFPTHTFSLLMGADNFSFFHKWKQYEEILQNHHLIVYPRKGAEKNILQEHPKIQMLDTLLIDISSSYIRERIKKKMSLKYIVPDAVIAYIEEKKLYYDAINS